jgi:hypothetical protein
MGNLLGIDIENNKEQAVFAQNASAKGFFKKIVP